MCWECIIKDIIVAIVCGMVASFFVWYIPAIVIMPKIKCGIFTHTNNKREISIINESKHFDAFDLICYIEYLDSEKHGIFSETISIPIIKQDNKTIVKLKTLSQPQKKSNDNKPSLKMFIENNTKQVEVIITYQNKFGSRQSTLPISLDFH